MTHRLESRRLSVVPTSTSDITRSLCPAADREQSAFMWDRISEKLKSTDELLLARLDPAPGLPKSTCFGTGGILAGSIARLSSSEMLSDIFNQVEREWRLTPNSLATNYPSLATQAIAALQSYSGRTVGAVLWQPVCEPLDHRALHDPMFRLDRPKRLQPEFHHPDSPDRVFQHSRIRDFRLGRSRRRSRVAKTVITRRIECRGSGLHSACEEALFNVFIDGPPADQDCRSLELGQIPAFVRGYYPAAGLQTSPYIQFFALDPNQPGMTRFGFHLCRIKSVVTPWITDYRWGNHSFAWMVNAAPAYGDAFRRLLSGHYFSIPAAKQLSDPHLESCFVHSRSSGCLKCIRGGRASRRRVFSSTHADFCTMNGIV
jgi:hypothetical protein